MTPSELVDKFKHEPKPAPGFPVNLEAAHALLKWFTHPHVCSGGDLSSVFVPAYLRGLIDEVVTLRLKLDEAREDRDGFRLMAERRIGLREDLARELNVSSPYSEEGFAQALANIRLWKGMAEVAARLNDQE